MGGLSVATFLTLGNLPAFYTLLFRVKRPADERQLEPIGSTIHAVHSDEGTPAAGAIGSTPLNDDAE